MARSVAGVLPAHVPGRKIPTSRLTFVGIHTTVVSNKAFNERLCSIPNSAVIQALSLHTDSWGLGWLASSEDVSGQEVRARASHGWP